MRFEITGYTRFVIDVPFTEVAGRNMRRQLAGWKTTEILLLETNLGLTGLGETIVNYTWARVPEHALDAVIGENPFDLLYRDELGAGLQIALWDLAAQYAGVPVYALIGEKVRDEVPIAWWCIDMPPEDWAIEAQAARERGYTNFKLKGRPWFDIVDQIATVCEVVPEGFHIDIDFNEFLLDAENALPVLRELERFPNVTIFESPIPQADIEGNRRLREALRSEIAHHFGNPPVATAVREGVCDGFVLCAGAARLLSQAHTAAMLDMPFWIQLVGTGITTTWANHLGAALSHARWPAITCLNVYSEQLITEPIVVSNGHIEVREEPGLGIALDKEAVARLAAAPKAEEPRAIYEIHFHGDFTVYYKDCDSYRADFHARKLPARHRDVHLTTWFDDGSPEFEEMYQQVQNGPVRVAPDGL